MSDDGDIHEKFGFVRSRAADYNAELCPPGEMIRERTMPIDTATAFHAVLDQEGRIPYSSTDAGTKFGRVRVEAGVATCFRVVAGDTMGGPVGYRSTAYETNWRRRSAGLGCQLRDTGPLAFVVLDDNQFVGREVQRSSPCNQCVEGR